VHAGSSEIVPYIQYMVGRNSGQYLASHPSWYRKQRQLQVNHSYQYESRAIADTAGSFRPETLLQPYPLPAGLPNTQTATVQQKLDELRVLLGKFCSPQDAHKILEWTNIPLGQGDESFLNNKLEQLRMLDRQGWRPI
jgi:hypothetical protein